MKKMSVLPKRKYCNGNKKMVSWRMPEALIRKLEKIAEQNGWTVTDVVATALDGFVQAEELENK